MLSYIIPFLILILVVVFIHEYGHYYFARKYGVGVTDFSIGFGKELFGWNDKSGTRWKICAIPLGGYVKFFGDRNVYSQADHKEILESRCPAFPGSQGNIRKPISNISKSTKNVVDFHFQ